MKTLLNHQSYIYIKNSTELKHLTNIKIVFKNMFHIKSKKILSVISKNPLLMNSWDIAHTIEIKYYRSIQL